MVAHLKGPESSTAERALVASVGSGIREFAGRCTVKRWPGISSLEDCGAFIVMTIPKRSDPSCHEGF